MKRIELLAPAGNFECEIQAINNGADAVYLGSNLFSARAFADNFNNDEIVEAINYAHLRNVKVYVTINTLLNEYEIDNAYNLAKFLYEHKVDALLIQDLGLFYRLRKDFPDLELHASTQLHIHNLQGVKNASKLGFKRVVLARESSLELISECTKEDVEIECFVHGAICVSYSGQCLMSSAAKNRSANKGMCAQMCRLKYKLYQNSKEIKTNTDYLLSPKDMCLLDDIPKLIEAGVSSLKIEGRMKSPAYVGYVTRCYRQAIDAYYSSKEYKLTDEIINNLKLLYNRGFTNTYLLNDSKHLFDNKRPNHMGVEIGKVVKVNGNKCYIQVSKQLNQFDGIRIISNNDTGLILNYLKVNSKLVPKAYPNEVIEISIEDKVKEGDIVVKTLDFELEKSILNSKDKLIPINLNISINSNDNVRIHAYNDEFEYDYISKIQALEAINKPINNSNIIESFNKVDTHPYVVSNYNISINNAFLPIKTINEIRRTFYDKLDLFRLNSFKRSKFIELNIQDIHEFKQNEIMYEKDYYINPVININSKYISNFISEFGGILMEGDKNAYYTLNISNSYAFEFLLKLGFKNIILSTELSEQMIIKLIDSFKTRVQTDIKPYILISGNRTLMYINRDPFKDYIDNYDNLLLSDGFNSYKIVKNKDNFIEIIEKNSVNKDAIDETLSYIK